jgi:sec-independent protein translocase protein TatA
MKKLKRKDSKLGIFVLTKTKNMFGIGGGELIFIMFIVLMLFGSDKVPEMARTMGKAMAQLKNATNDIKSEIQKGAEANGFDTKSLSDFRGSITSEINKAKDNLMGEASQFKDISESISTEVNKTKDSLVDETTSQIDATKKIVEDAAGPIKRKM